MCIQQARREIGLALCGLEGWTHLGSQVSLWFWSAGRQVLAQVLLLLLPLRVGHIYQTACPLARILLSSGSVSRSEGLGALLKRWHGLGRRVERRCPSLNDFGLWCSISFTSSESSVPHVGLTGPKRRHGGRSDSLLAPSKFMPPLAPRHRGGSQGTIVVLGGRSLGPLPSHPFTWGFGQNLPTGRGAISRGFFLG